MPYIEIKLTAGEYADLERAAYKKGMSVDSFIHWATDQIVEELGNLKMDLPPAAAPAYAPPAYPAPLAGVGAPVYQMPYPARPGASGQAGEIDRLRQMVAVKRSIDAELVSFAERVIMGV